MNYGLNEMSAAPVMPGEEPQHKSFKDSVQETRGKLKELLLIMGETNCVLFGFNPIGDSEKEPESKCLEDDIYIINRQASAALSIFADIRRGLI